MVERPLELVAADRLLSERRRCCQQGDESKGNANHAQVPIRGQSWSLIIAEDSATLKKRKIRRWNAQCWECAMLQDRDMQESGAHPSGQILRPGETCWRLARRTAFPSLSMQRIISRC